MEKESTSKKAHIARGIVQKNLNAIGRRIASILSKKFEPLPLRWKKTLLICFGLAVTIACIGMIVHPFFKEDTGLLHILSKRIETPDVRNPPDEMFPEADYHLLMGFKRTLDSLKVYDPDTYQQMTHDRQGLLDSIDYLIGIYGKIKQ